MKTLEQLSRSQFQLLSQLMQKKYRSERGEFLIEGVHLVEEALASDWEVTMVLVGPVFVNRNEFAKIARLAAGKGAGVYETTQREIDKLSDTVTSQGITAVVKMKEPRQAELWGTQSKKSLIVALDTISDPGNLGTILRTCDWFGVDAVVLGNGSAEVYNPKVLRATMGALFHLKIFSDIDLIPALREAKRTGFGVTATMLSGGKMVRPADLPDKCVYVFGNEAQGLPESIVGEADTILTIPKFGKAESLNVAAACAVVLGAIKL